MAKKKKSVEQTLTESIASAQEDRLTKMVKDTRALLNNETNVKIQYLAERVRAELDQVRDRAVALEKLLIENTDVTLEDILEKVMEVEDARSALIKADREAQKGDTVRITYKTKKQEDKDFSQEEGVKIANLGVEPYSVFKEVEEGILGLKAGDSKEVEVNTADSEGNINKFTVALTLNRVSQSLVTSKKENKEGEKDAAEGDA